MVEITTTPTNLNIYYCENCHGIIATTNLEAIPETLNFKCLFCFEDSLVRLPIEDYQTNFNRELFPYPQNILLENFFIHADNTLNLLTSFAKTGAILLLGEVLTEIESYNGLHILFSPDIKITIKLDVNPNYSTSIFSNASNLIGALSESN